jgi:hypothetical protein
MKTEDKNNIAKALKERAESQNLSYANLAVMIPGKISPATISQIVNGKHDLISDKMWNLISVFLDYRTGDTQGMATVEDIKAGALYDPATHSLKKWVIEKTDNFNAISKRCMEAQTQSRFRAVSGFTGAGKTTALKNYASNTENTYYLLCTRSMNAKEFISSLLRVLGIQFDGTMYRCLEAVKERLNKIAKPLLILDDAGKLNDNCLRLIQEIYDATEFHAGLVIAGTDEELKDYITKASKKNKPGFRQLKSRIQDWQPMNTPKHLFIERICGYYGITEEASVNYVCYLCRDYRSLRNLITNAARVANGRITLDNLQAVGARNELNAI